jgi:hypothetical protein
MPATEDRPYSKSIKTTKQANYHLRLAKRRIESLLQIISDLKAELKTQRLRADRAEKIIKEFGDYYDLR